MFLPTGVFVISCFLVVSSYYHSCNVNGTLTSWPSIPVASSNIEIASCANFESIPALAASSRPYLLELHLAKNAISQIVNNWLENSPGIQIITLHLNKLENIPAFNCGPAGSEGCPELITINIYGNLLVSIPGRSFINHPKLQSLLLHKNRLTTLASNWIVNCPSLAEIRLHKNVNLTTFLISEDLASQGHAHLESIFLYDCNITSLRPDFLFLFPNLSKLRIYDNPITTLPLYVATHPVKIYLETTGNFVCDCSTVELARTGRILSTSETSFCASPSYNVGKNFAQLQCIEVQFRRRGGCRDVDGSVMSRGPKVWPEYVRYVTSGEHDVFVPRSDRLCLRPSVWILVAGSPDASATYRVCPMEAHAAGHCRFRCTCTRVECAVFVKFEVYPKITLSYTQISPTVYTPGLASKSDPQLSLEGLLMN